MMYLMSPSFNQIINQNFRALTSRSKGKKQVTKSEQEIYEMEKKLTSLKVEHIEENL